MISIACNVLLLPDDELAAKAVTASRSLEPYGTLFTLEDDKIYPHVSVYMFQLKSEDIPKVKELLAGIAAKTRQLAAYNLAK